MLHLPLKSKKKNRKTKTKPTKSTILSLINIINSISSLTYTIFVQVKKTQHISCTICKKKKELKYGYICCKIRYKSCFRIEHNNDTEKMKHITL